jgi:MerR family transcriptional regulator, repressor of the yfmOP operon
MSTDAPSLRIGDVAKLAGTTPRTIRYYEEIGLLPQAPSRPSGGHRVYTDAEVERLREVMRLKDLLGVTLDELKTLLAAEESRAIVRAKLRREDIPPERRRELLDEALGHLDRQLELVEHRAGELAKLKGELCETRKRVRRKIRELTPAETGTDQGDTRSARIPESAGGEGARLLASAEGAFPPPAAHEEPPESVPEPA